MASSSALFCRMVLLVCMVHAAPGKSSSKHRLMRLEREEKNSQIESDGVLGQVGAKAEAADSVRNNVSESDVPGEEEEEEEDVDDDESDGAEWGSCKKYKFGQQVSGKISTTDDTLKKLDCITQAPNCKNIFKTCVQDMQTSFPTSGGKKCRCFKKLKRCLMKSNCCDSEERVDLQMLDREYTAFCTGEEMCGKVEERVMEISKKRKWRRDRLKLDQNNAVADKAEPKKPDGTSDSSTPVLMDKTDSATSSVQAFIEESRARTHTDEDEAQAIGLMIRRFGEGPDGNGGINLPEECDVPDATKLGDGRCDMDGNYNTAGCNWDGGDCCEETCKPAFFQCDSNGYDCKGTVVRVLFNESFECEGKRQEFQELYDKWHDDLVFGSSMQSTDRCQAAGITQTEHRHVAQAFNMGIQLQAGTPDMRSAQARLGGPGLSVACQLWKDQMGNEWFGSLVTHEMGHVAGYSHPLFKDSTFTSECKLSGQKLCEGHCMKWVGACETPLSFGSEQCGTFGEGCQALCVHSDYCMKLPERITECFGYQKVHSRGDGLGDQVTSLAGETEQLLGDAKDKTTGWFCDSLGWFCDDSKAERHGLTVPLAVSLMPLLAYVTSN